MTKGKSLLLSLLVGVTISAALGFYRTSLAAKALYLKNLALIEAGRAALPGKAHLDVLASTAPGFAGALFFGLALGAGFSIVAFIWFSVWPKTRAPLKYLSLLPLLAVAGWPLFRGEIDTALALSAIGAIAFYLTRNINLFDLTSLNDWKIKFASLLILAAGFLPWLLQGQSSFVYIRDVALIRSDLLRPVSDFYYRWTLYPAEAIKPLDLKTQPLVAAADNIPGEFCPQAWWLGLLCVPSGTTTAEFKAEATEGKTTLSALGDTMTWRYSDQAQNAKNLKDLADRVDGARALRKLTLYSLLYGSPLALFCLFLLAVLSSGRKPASVIGTAIIISLLIGYSGLPNEEYKALQPLAQGQPTPEAVKKALASKDPLERLYGTLGAGQNPEAYRAELLMLLGDPIVNVRYSAANALGGAPGTETTGKLMELLNGNDEWYVKFRAYNSLTRQGWTP